MQGLKGYGALPFLRGTQRMMLTPQYTPKRYLPYCQEIIYAKGYKIKYFQSNEIVIP